MNLPRELWDLIAIRLTPEAYVTFGATSKVVRGNLSDPIVLQRHLAMILGPDVNPLALLHYRTRNVSAYHDRFYPKLQLVIDHGRKDRPRVEIRDILPIVKIYRTIKRIVDVFLIQANDKIHGTLDIELPTSNSFPSRLSAPFTDTEIDRVTRAFYIHDMALNFFWRPYLQVVSWASTPADGNDDLLQQYKRDFWSCFPVWERNLVHHIVFGFLREVVDVGKLPILPGASQERTVTFHRTGKASGRRKRTYL
jgi:hypothetical protein